MASSSNRRSDSSGSSRSGTSKNAGSSNIRPSDAQSKNPKLNRKQAGRYANASTTTSSTFSKRVEQSKGAPDVAGKPRETEVPRTTSSSRASSKARSSSQSASTRQTRPTQGSSRQGQTGTGRTGSTYDSGTSASRNAARSQTQRNPSHTTVTSDRTRASSSSSAVRRDGSRQLEIPRVAPSTAAGNRSARVQAASERRIADIKAQQRDERLAATYRRHVLKLVGFLAIIAAVVVLCFVIYNSPLFTITDVEVTGNGYLSSDEVVELADIPDGMTLLRLDKNKVIANICTNPWVRSCQVHWSVPHGVEIVIEEREIIAAVTIPLSAQNTTVTKWAIASDGTWLDRVSDSPTGDYETMVKNATDGVPLIGDVTSTISPAAGQICSDAGISNVLDILNTISADLSGQIVSVSAPSVEQTTLTLSNDVTVAFGSSTEALAKERIVLQLLAEHENNISYINVRVVDRPAWRGLT